MKALKKTVIFSLLVLICFSLASCSGFDGSRADGSSEAFIKAMLAKDVDSLRSLTHPSYKEAIEYGDDFYSSLELYGILPGDPLDGMEAKEKKAAYDDEVKGNLIICSYVAMIDQMYYDAVIYILDNESGYGIIGAEFRYCTDPEYYK